MAYSDRAHTTNFYDQLSVSSERTLPPSPYPRSYMHCALTDLEDAVRAVYALRVVGYAAQDIHVLSRWDYVEACERLSQERGAFLNLFWRLSSFFDEGFGDTYLRAARAGGHILAVRLASRNQVEQTRQILAAHHAHLIKYVDSWVTVDLSSERGDNSAPFPLERVLELLNRRGEANTLYPW